jgi:hypothetical protein
MSKHKVEIKFSFTGSQVNLYPISKDELAQLIKNRNQENPLPYYEIIQSDGHLICSGLDPIDGQTSIQILVDGNPIEVDGYSIADDQEDADNLRLTEKNSMIINSENRRDLEGEIPQDMHALIVREFFKSASAIVNFEADKAVCASDFELLILSADNDSDFSEVTYHADILPTESDLVGVVFDGITAEPDIHIDNFKDQELFLFARDASGKFNFVET